MEHILAQDSTNVSFISHVRFLFCIIRFIGLPTLPSPSSPVFPKVPSKTTWRTSWTPKATSLFLLFLVARCGCYCGCYFQGRKLFRSQGEHNNVLSFVINMPTRDVLVPYTKRSFQMMVGALALRLQCLSTLNIAFTMFQNLVRKKRRTTFDLFLSPGRGRSFGESLT